MAFSLKFVLKFVLTQFKFIPSEFKYRRDSNGLNIHFRAPTKTDARIHFTSYVFMHLCMPMDPLLEYFSCVVCTTVLVQFFPLFPPIYDAPPPPFFYAP